MSIMSWTQQLQSRHLLYPRNRVYDDGTSFETMFDPRERFNVEVFVVVDRST